MIKQAIETAWQICAIFTAPAAPTAVVRDIIDRLAGPDGEIPGLEVRNPSLEDYYLDLVSRYHTV